MADNHSKDVRSYNMSCIKSQNTKPEEIVRKYLFSQGLRYRKNDKSLPGHPDIVLPKYKTIVFVHGCFWHLHKGCRYAVMPSSNVDYWEKKLHGNQLRDERVKSELQSMGWKVLTIWECQLKKEEQEESLNNLYQMITRL